MGERVTRNSFEKRYMEESKDKKDRVEVVIKANHSDVFEEYKSDFDIRLYESRRETIIRTFIVYFNEEVFVYETRRNYLTPIPMSFPLFYVIPPGEDGNKLKVQLYRYDVNPASSEYISTDIIGHRIMFSGDENERDVHIEVI